MAVDSFSHSSSDVLNDIDPLSRALLDLSVQRGMDDAEIAGVLGTDAEAVFEVRVGLLRNLADKVAPEHADADVPELQAVIAERLYADPVDEPPARAVDDLEEPDERATAVHAVPAGPPDPPATVPKPRKRRSPLVYLIPLLLLAAIGAGVVALTSGGDDSEPNAGAPAASEPRPAPASGKPADAKPPTPRATRLQAIGDTSARGTARIDGDRLTLKLRGLPAAPGGAYEVWLYDSVIDARSLAASKEPKIDLDAKLPANARDFEWVDVSLEPADGNPNHSGRSLLRVPLAKLAK